MGLFILVLYFAFTLTVRLLKYGKSIFLTLPVIFIISISCNKEKNLRSYDYKALGISAHDLLSSSLYTSLDIEISYVPGYEPDSAVLYKLKSFLNTYLNKPSGIVIKMQEIQNINKNDLTLEDVVTIEKKCRNLFTSGNEIAVHILITDGYYYDKPVFAISYWNTSICIFGQAINESSIGINQMARENMLASFVEHEFCHLIGLVNQGTPMLLNHRDSIHGAHCNNPKCLMYYVEDLNSYKDFNNFVIPELDDNCKADLKSNGGK